MQHRADVVLKMTYVPGVGHRIEQFTINGMAMDRVVSVLFEADAEDVPLMTMVMLPTDIEIVGECPVETTQLSNAEAIEYEEDEDEEPDPEREFRN